MSRETHVLVVEDEPKIAALLRDYLVAAGYRVSTLERGDGAVEWIRAHAPDAVLLDVMLPGKDGLAVCRDVRAFADTPILMLTARVDEIDRLLGLELGADDYIVKPYGLREFLARVRAVLRRVAAQAASRPAEAPYRRFDGWVLNRRRRRLINPDGVEVVLGKREYALLAAFLDAPQRPLSREYLLQVTRVHDDVFDRCIDVQILRLRRKIERRPSDPKLILTERGVGYVFAAAVESTSH